jgi:membrane protease YdiL (CAAX protease family)
MITAPYPLAGTTLERPHTAAAPVRRAWGFWATLGWLWLATLAFAAASFLTGFSYALWWILAHPQMPVNVMAMTLGLLATAVSVPAGALLLFLASRKRGWSAREYLGLVMPRMRHIAMGMGALVAFWALVEIVVYVFPTIDQSELMTKEYRLIMGSGVDLALFWFILVGTAPVAEEIIFRGFLMRGWSESKIGAMGALLLSSTIFAAIHTQYNPAGMAIVFGLGLIFGMARLRSGSTVLTILMHSAWNLAAGIAIALTV